MVRLILLAHAEAARPGAFPGGEGLSSRGRADAAALRGALPRHDAALTAPEAAARETAAALGLDAAIDEAWRDLDLGSWAGRDLAEIAAADPAGTSAFASDPAFAGHGGESLAAFVCRIGRGLDAARDKTGITLAVVSPATAKAALAAALGAPPAAIRHIDIAHLDALTLGSDGRRWTLRRLGPLG